jgi:hypothetical protein
LTIIASDSQNAYDTSDDAMSRGPARRASGVRSRVERSLSEPPLASAETALALISIGAPANVALLEPTYAYLSAYSFACLPPQLAQRLNVAIYELYANALRYGAATSEVRLEIFKTAAGARLSISNAADLAQREKLELQIARVKHNPEAAFATEMERFADGGSTPPMLGIVRVVHESALVVDLHIEGDRVRVSTVCEG